MIYLRTGRVNSVYLVPTSEESVEYIGSSDLRQFSVTKIRNI